MSKLILLIRISILVDAAVAYPKADYQMFGACMVIENDKGCLPIPKVNLFDCLFSPLLNLPEESYMQETLYFQGEASNRREL